MIAKVCDRESRRDSWFENRLVYYAIISVLVGDLNLESWHPIPPVKECNSEEVLRFL